MTTLEKWMEIASTRVSSMMADRNHILVYKTKHLNELKENLHQSVDVFVNGVVNSVQEFIAKKVDSDQSGFLDVSINLDRAIMFVFQKNFEINNGGFGMLQDNNKSTSPPVPGWSLTTEDDDKGDPGSWREVQDRLDVPEKRIATLFIKSKEHQHCDQTQGRLQENVETITRKNNKKGTRKSRSSGNNFSSEDRASLEAASFGTKLEDKVRTLSETVACLNEKLSNLDKFVAENVSEITSIDRGLQKTKESLQEMKEALLLEQTERNRASNRVDIRIGEIERIHNKDDVFLAAAKEDMQATRKQTENIRLNLNTSNSKLDLTSKMVRQVENKVRELEKKQKERDFDQTDTSSSYLWYNSGKPLDKLEFKAEHSQTDGVKSNTGTQQSYESTSRRLVNASVSTVSSAASGLFNASTRGLNWMWSKRNK